MKITLNQLTTLSDVLQGFCLVVLENVDTLAGKTGGGPEGNGSAGAKLGIIASIGLDYIYAGFDQRGVFTVFYKADLSSGPAQEILSIPLARVTMMETRRLALRIFKALPDRQP